jgi:hypothetical protein
MPALKPQSSANKASYVAAGRRLSSGWGRKHIGGEAVPKAFAGIVFHFRKTVPAFRLRRSRTESASAKKVSVWDSLDSRPGKRDLAKKSDTESTEGFSPHILKGEQRSLWLL